MERALSKKSDAELVRLVVLKDVEALEVLYDKYSAPLYGNLLKLVKDEQTASEVLEKAFISLWMNCPESACQKTSFFVWMNNQTRDIALEKFNERIRRNQFTSARLPYVTPMGKLLTSVTFK